MRIRQVSSHTRVVSILIGAFLLILALVLVYLGRSRPQVASAQQSSSLQVQLKPFVGQWYAHGGAFTVKFDGDAQLVARTYQWCGPGVSSLCDSMQGNTIVPGINERMQFTSVAGSTASGKILASTGKNIGAAVTMTTGRDDTLILSGLGTLCGPRSTPGLCGA